MPDLPQTPARDQGDLGLVDSLVQTSFLVQRVLRRVARQHDLSIPQVRLLGILRDREPGILALAEHLDLDKSSVTGLVDRAAQRGLVERFSRPDDGRAVRVALTRSGRALAAGFAEQVGEELLAVTAGLSEPQRRRLTSLLSQVVLEEREAGQPVT